MAASATVTRRKPLKPTSAKTCTLAQSQLTSARWKWPHWTITHSTAARCVRTAAARPLRLITATVKPSAARQEWWQPKSLAKLTALPANNFCHKWHVLAYKSTRNNQNETTYRAASHSLLLCSSQTRFVCACWQLQQVWAAATDYHQHDGFHPWL